MAFGLLGLVAALVTGAQSISSTRAVIGQPGMFTHLRAITSVAEMVAERFAGNLVGRDVILADVVVAEVLGERVFLLRHDDETVPVVLFGELTGRQLDRAVTLEEGQRLRIYGVVRQLRVIAEIANEDLLDPGEAAKLREHEIYVSALHVAPLPIPDRERSPSPEREPSPTPERERSPTPDREPSPTPYREPSPTPYREPSPTADREPSPTPPPEQPSVPRVITSIAQLAEVADRDALRGRDVVLDQVRVLRVLGDHVFIVGDERDSVLVALFGELTQRQLETATVIRADDIIRIYGVVRRLRSVQEIEDLLMLSPEDARELRAHDIYVSALRVVQQERSP